MYGKEVKLADCNACPLAKFIPLEKLPEKPPHARAPGRREE